MIKLSIPSVCLCLGLRKELLTCLKDDTISVNFVGLHTFVSKRVCFVKSQKVSDSDRFTQTFDTVVTVSVSLIMMSHNSITIHPFSSFPPHNPQLRIHPWSMQLSQTSKYFPIVFVFGQKWSDRDRVLSSGNKKNLKEYEGVIEWTIFTFNNSMF